MPSIQNGNRLGAGGAAAIILSVNNMMRVRCILDDKIKILLCIL